MHKASSKTCLKSDLARELADYRITASPFNPEFHFEDMLSEVNECKVVKENNRRQVYHLQTAERGYFLKHSSLVRKKDRLRHFLLPRRRWAEWRNLHRLRDVQVPAAKPLAKGQPKISHPKSYFVLTEQVLGTHIPINSLANARSLGQYTAFLHRRKIYHADLNRKNFILNPEGQLYLLDAQEVYILPWMPRWLRVNNLGKIYFNLASADVWQKWTTAFLDGYNRVISDNVTFAELNRAAGRHQQRKYRSRVRRCCKNSTEFVIVNADDSKGFKRRDFSWGTKELRQALANGLSLKESQVIYYQDICIKKHRRGILHRDRCKASWKMSRALEVRGIAVPRAWGYLLMDGDAHFLSELILDSLHLNDFLSSLCEPAKKRQVLKKLAIWLRKIHDTNIWQRDFKSNNILCRDGEFFMIDLDDVKIRRLSEHQKVVNLAQLNASVSNAITLRDRIRFYHYYTAGRELTKHQRRAVYRKVWEITETKQTAIYDLKLDSLWRHRRL